MCDSIRPKPGEISGPAPSRRAFLLAAPVAAAATVAGGTTAEASAESEFDRMKDLVGDPRRGAAMESPAREELVAILEEFEAACRRLRNWYDAVDERPDAAVLLDVLDDDAYRWRETIQSLYHLPQLLVTDLQSEYLFERDLTPDEIKALFEDVRAARAEKGGAK